ncbi:bifunctional acetate--CoA ligase family protein/GNAT family N-acetyltransferase [Oceanibium sediminis]|uniref:bifunctional acetate--CoA ligase family protein/GNAT family N-acetyltransferase n=1 Tax=Oceanibium sediminis TaxID=2026339 RepID=UPI000DD2D7AB|nr:bifunctional acetate--CoA ligase family protein/GNAT family N-acetyltransferase [Oceanibium sediminis]
MISGPPQIPLSALFDPGSVAVFGASEREGSVGARVFAKLTSGDFAGDVVPINPKYETVGGRPCFASILDIGRPVDLAVIAAPAKFVPGIIRDCGAAGTRAAIVLSAGFAEAGAEGKTLEAELKQAVCQSGVRVLGPNCVGLVRPWHGLDATFLRASTPKGRLALVSQSGALCSAISDWAEPHHLGFSALVSMGNTSDIDFGDVLQFLAYDPKTAAILLYVEGIRDAGSFISSLRMAARNKPVIVLKSGRNNQSSKAATTHTGALMGDDAVFDAALSRGGAVRAQTFGQLFAAAEILAANRRAEGNRLGIVTNGGGAGVLAADRAGDLGVELATLGDKTVATLDKLLPTYWSRGNPIDILGDASPAQYGAAVKAALADPNLDGLLVMLTPQAMTEATEAAQAVVDATSPRQKKPVLACWMGETSVTAGRNLLSAKGIPDFTTPERAVEAFSYLAQYHRNRLLALEVPEPFHDHRMPDLEGARMIIDAALADGRSMLSDLESKAVLRAFAINVNTTLHAKDAAEALVAAETVGFPVAMKISSRQISHKSDVGGVRMGILTAADVKLAFHEMIERVQAERPDAQIDGVTVERMAGVEDARELVIGVSRDPVFGPAILFGAGGTMVEVLRDSAVALPPLNAILARRMIDRTRVSRLLEAIRDRRAVDRKAVIDVLLRVSDMVCELPEITELDINPLFAGPDAVLAVDARIAIARPPARQGRYDHVAIRPYPRHLVSHDHLSDGTPLTIRPIRPEDAESEAAFVRALSPEAKRFRFMGAMSELSAEMLVRFTQIDYRREIALVAVVTRDGKDEQHGVARYAINQDGTSCEFAIVVSDVLRRQGIGTKLMRALFAAARDHELTRMEGIVLAENTGMLNLMDELGFSRMQVPDDPDVVHVERWL